MLLLFIPTAYPRSSEFSPSNIFKYGQRPLNQIYSNIIVLYDIISYGSVFYYIIVYCIVLYYIILYYIVLYYCYHYYVSKSTQQGKVVPSSLPQADAEGAAPEARKAEFEFTDNPAL